MVESSPGVAPVAPGRSAAAIAETRAAATRAPDDPRVTLALQDMYRDKVDLLASVVRLATDPKG